MRRQFHRDESADAVSEHDCVASERVDRFARQRDQVVELKFAEWRRRALAECGAQVWHIDFPSDGPEITEHDREMARGGEELGEQKISARQT